MDNYEMCQIPPQPYDFDAYLPYGCRQLGVEEFIIVKRIERTDAPVTTTKNQKVKSSEDSVEPEEVASNANILPAGIIRVFAEYDKSNYLVQIEMDKYCKKPPGVLKLIKLLIAFHPNLTSFIAKGYINQYTVPQISDILSVSNITDVTLDDSFVIEGNYHLLFEGTNCLKNLSLARCKINDAVIETIVAKLTWPNKASTVLNTLNLTTNFITDEGAKMFAEIFKTNRALYYLNLADNQLTDDGAQAILYTLKEFPLTNQELLDKRYRYCEYLKKKQDIIDDLSFKEDAESIKSGLSEKRHWKSSAVKNEKEKEKDEIAVRILGPFKDPYDSDNTFFKYDLLHCRGNFVLCYLNLAYNNLTYPTLLAAVEVLKYQKMHDRVPRGLFRLNLEGNVIPYCKELLELNELTKTQLLTEDKKSTNYISKKK